MKNAVFPALFEVDSGTIAVSFPDVPGCLTCGGDYADALACAEDALNLLLMHMEDTRQPLPAPSDPASIAIQPGQVLALVPVDTEAYRRTTSNRAVKRTLTIPAWMAYQAEERGINLSQTLQDALREKLATWPQTFSCERKRP